MKLLLFLLISSSLILNQITHTNAYGETLNGYPNAKERENFNLINLVRMFPLEYKTNYMSGYKGLNNVFSQYGKSVPPVYYDYNLNRLARSHSQDMATNRCFQHDSCNGQSIWTRFDSFITCNGQSSGENIAAGSSPFEANNLLVCDEVNGQCAADNSGSDGHRVNIMSDSFKTMGVGWVEQSGTTYGDYLTQDFHGGNCNDINNPIYSAYHTFYPSTSIQFIALFYSDTESVTKFSLIFEDGTSHSIPLTYGSSSKGAFIITLPSVESCAKYYFAATTSSNTYKMPETGYFQVSESSSCEGWINGDTSTTEAPTIIVPTTEPPVTEAPTTQPPATEAPTTQPPATEAPTTQPPATEAPTTQPPATEAPTTQPPATEAPSTQPPATEAPSTQPPSTEAPTTQPPITEAPTTQPPATEVPTTQAPSTEAPTTQPPATEVPTTQAPSTQPPVTEAPTESTSNESSGDLSSSTNNDNGSSASSTTTTSSDSKSEDSNNENGSSASSTTTTSSSSGNSNNDNGSSASNTPASSSNDNSNNENESSASSTTTTSSSSGNSNNDNGSSASNTPASSSNDNSNNDNGPTTTSSSSSSSSSIPPANLEPSSEDSLDDSKGSNGFTLSPSFIIMSLISIMYFF